MKRIEEAFAIRGQKATVVVTVIEEDVLRVGDTVQIPLKNGEIASRKVIEFAVLGHMKEVVKGDKVGVVVDYVPPEEILIDLPRAEKKDWKIVDMPLERTSFSLELKLTQEEFAQLQKGHIPKEMEDKWFAYFEENRLYIHRSWTGYCIFIVTFSPEGSVQEVLVNRNPQQYKETDIKRDKLLVTIRINHLAGRKENQELIKEYIKKP